MRCLQATVAPYLSLVSYECVIKSYSRYMSLDPYILLLTSSFVWCLNKNFLHDTKFGVLGCLAMGFAFIRSRTQCTFSCFLWLLFSIKTTLQTHLVLDWSFLVAEVKRQHIHFISEQYIDKWFVNFLVQSWSKYICHIASYVCWIPTCLFKSLYDNLMCWRSFAGTANCHTVSPLVLFFIRWW